MLDIILFCIWLPCFIIAAVPPVGRWVYVRMISRIERLKTLIDDNLF